MNLPDSERDAAARRVQEAQEETLRLRALVNSLPLASTERVVALRALGTMSSTLEKAQEQYFHDYGVDPAP